MYYSVKVIGTKELYNLGTTDANGETEIFYSDIADKAYLYIGHRTETFENLPTSRSTPEQISDECDLNNDGGQQITMTPHEEKKPPITIQTQRLWKPWIVSSKQKPALIKSEGFILNPYLDSENYATVGIGHLIHVDKGFVMNEEKVSNVIHYLKNKNIPINKANIQNNLSNALNLTGITLKNAIAEMEFVDSLTASEAIKLFEKDIKNHVVFIDEVMVPLYQHEYDALVDLCFNGGSAVLRDTGRKGKRFSGIKSTLNSGK